MTYELDCTQPLSEEADDNISRKTGRSEVHVSATVQLNQAGGTGRMTKLGSGSNLDRALRDAIHNIVTDPRLKGKRASSILPATVVFQLDRFSRHED